MQLIAENLACVRGGRRVFDGVSLRVGPGEALLLTGANGSGKTSLLRLIAGFVPAAAGALRLEGVGDDGLTIGQRAHFVGHLDAVKAGLDVFENLQFWADLMGGAKNGDGATRDGDVAAALEAFDLARFARFPASLLSAGQKRRLALARLMLGPRPLWLLDEPNVALDAASRARLDAAMAAHLAKGGLIVASSHAAFGIAFAHGLELGGKPAAAGTNRKPASRKKPPGPLPKARPAKKRARP